MNKKEKKDLDLTIQNSTRTSQPHESNVTLILDASQELIPRSVDFILPQHLFFADCRRGMYASLFMLDGMD